MQKQQLIVQPSKFRADGVNSGYSELAAEYYDEARHPTCANYAAAGERVIGTWLRDYPKENSWMCEIGAGRSAVAEYLSDKSRDLSRLVLTDSSPSMLRHSARFASYGANLILADAEALPLKSDSFEFAVSMLGDPYNTPAFWKEMSRILRSGGRSLYTTPPYAWAIEYRARRLGRSLDSAEFETVDSRLVSVPSLIYPIEHQRAMIEDAGLRVDEIVEATIGELAADQISSKLLTKRGLTAPVLTSFAMVKP